MNSRFDTAKNLFLEGTSALEKGDLDSAELYLIECLRLIPDRESTKHNLAILFTLRADALSDRKKHDEALISYSKALEFDENYAIAWSHKGVILNDHFDVIDEAISCFEKALQLIPSYADAHLNLGVAHAKNKNYSKAFEHYESALKYDPNCVEAWINRGNAYNDLKRHEEALASFGCAIKLQPNLPEAWGFQSKAFGDLKRYEEALVSADNAIRLRPHFVEAWNNRGVALGDLERHEEALASHDRSIELKPEYAAAWSNRGIVLNDLRRHEEALASHDRSIELKSDFAEAWNNRGVALGDLKRHEEALASYDRAIELKPDYAEAWSNRGNALNDLKRHEEALASYERSIELKPDADYILGDLVHTQMKICDWTDLDERCHTLESRLLKGDRASTPFSVIGLFDDPPLQKRSAELYAKSKLGFKSLLGPITRRSRGDKIRVAYFSMDFREHPVAHLVAELIECHDRNKFEIFGFSFGVNTGDTMRKRLEDAFDKFLEVSNLSELDIARLARDHQIDIAIDLGGYTQDSRPAIFAHRAAPIQINYLGFPGTMGTGHLDYFIGDRVAVSDDNLGHFSEKVIFLPNSFQANPSQRPIGSKESSRATYNLPESGFVFCCFNNVWKITPDVFRIWVRILKEAKGSVLWILEDPAPARRHIEETFKKLGIESNRLVFSNRVSIETYFDQYQFADLFLDTLPYNAGTTASDALWMGLPVLTLAGRSFAGRMAASLLHAVGLPELITQTAEDHESLAVELANNPDRIAALKARLAKNRPTCTLFNTPLFTKHIESAYQAASDRYHAGLAPDHIYVSS
ncbi:MAG: tetratricopeptide repeat protein [Betaproteobacteria bacterium]|nr:tetratricopeptide repeat protein [Betaproteobacteria bacterium]